MFCYECHEELLHNPVFLPDDIEKFARLVRIRGLNEAKKIASKEKSAGRIRLLQEVINSGLAVLLQGQQENLRELQNVGVTAP